MEKIKQLIRAFNYWRWHGDGSDPRYLGTIREIRVTANERAAAKLRS